MLLVSEYFRPLNGEPLSHSEILIAGPRIDEGEFAFFPEGIGVEEYAVTNMWRHVLSSGHGGAVIGYFAQGGFREVDLGDEFGTVACDKRYAECFVAVLTIFVPPFSRENFDLCVGIVFDEGAKPSKSNFESRHVVRFDEEQTFSATAQVRRSMVLARSKFSKILAFYRQQAAGLRPSTLPAGCVNLALAGASQTIPRLVAWHCEGKHKYIAAREGHP